jgi:AcrR family transcriptional regulator
MAKTAEKRVRASQKPPEERKKQLLRAGVACFAQKGIGGTKHADLARACEVSVPAVFSYFPNRDALVTSILEEVGQALLDNVITPAQELPSAEQLRATAPLFIEYAQREPDFVKVWLIWSMHFAPGIQAQYQVFEKQLINALAEMFTGTDSGGVEEDDIQDRARMIVASSAFLAKMVFDGVSEKRREDFVNHVLKPLSLQS